MPLRDDIWHWILIFRASTRLDIDRPVRWNATCDMSALPVWLVLGPALPTRYEVRPRSCVRCSIRLASDRKFRTLPRSMRSTSLQMLGSRLNGTLRGHHIGHTLP